jgi:hypothetical protein
LTPKRGDFDGFLKRLVQAGHYKSERQMALDLGELQETVYGWRRAVKRPARLEAFLRRFAKRHEYDAEALVERWELVRQRGTGKDSVESALRNDPVRDLFGRHRHVCARIQDLLYPATATLEKLPSNYREQYREQLKKIRARIEARINTRLNEIADDIEREVVEILARLLAEAHVHRNERKSSDAGR